MNCKSTTADDFGTPEAVHDGLPKPKGVRALDPFADARPRGLFRGDIVVNRQGANNANDAPREQERRLPLARSRRSWRLGGSLRPYRPAPCHAFRSPSLLPPVG